MKKETAIEFLFFSYFGVSIKTNNEDTLLDFLIDKAYLDATQRGAYNFLLVSSEMKDKSNAAKDRAKTKIKTQISEFSSENYDEWVKKLIRDVEKEFNEIKKSGKKLFTIGNAQKWVNMTVKYILLTYRLLSIISEGDTVYSFCKSFGQKFSAVEASIHVPIDSYIIEAVWHTELEEDDNGKLKNKKEFDVKKIVVPLPKRYEKDIDRRNMYNSEYVKPWSAEWDLEREYISFQEGVKKLIKDTESPLDWENNAWINIAERRKRKEQNKNNK